MAQTALESLADSLTVEGELCQKLADRKVLCVACGHRCVIFDGKRGICKVRFNSGGTLKVPFGYAAAVQCDPTEKKPFFHVLPGSRALTFGMLGCDFHCPYCQNWDISQAIRDPRAGTHPIALTPEQMAETARDLGAALVVSSYNEPLITAEWSAAVFKLARTKGFKTAFVSNGNATPEALAFMRPHLDAYKVDLKGMRQENYRELGGKLSVVLDTIARLSELKVWVEIVTLVVPGFNDSENDLKDTARFIASVSPDIPWHVTAFHKDYKMTDPDNTAPETLIRACRIGEETGLRYVYAGNLPGQAEKYENTFCPSCKELLIERFGYQINRNLISGRGQCPRCGTPVPGIWS